MKRAILVRTFSMLALSSASAFGVDLKGPEELALMTQQVINSCSGASGTTSSRGGNDLAEQLMIPSTQQVASLYGRFLDSSTCAGPIPDEADGLLIGLDGIVTVVDSDSASTCGSSLASTTTLSVTDQNGVPGLQCPGCSASSYTFASWQEVLRVLYAGMPASAGSDLAQRDCNSDLRRSLANSYSSLFQSACSGTICSELKRAFRPSEAAGATPALLSMLGLPPASTSPFCNALQTDVNDPALQTCLKDADCKTFDCNETSSLCRAPRKPYFAEYQDNDPIRRPCTGTGNLPGPPTGVLGDPPPNEPTEQVCGRDGTLGLVLPIQPPQAGTSNANFPSKNCAKGRFFNGSVSTVAAGPPTVRDRCPNGDTTFLGGCLIPMSLDNDTACINGRNNLPTFKVDPNNATATDGRVYNRILRKGGIGADKGTISTVQRLDGTSVTNADVVGAFYKIHASRTLNTPANVSTCTQPEPANQTGCLAQASPCSMGVAAKRAAQFLGTKNLWLGGIEPSAANIRRLLTEPADPLTYPLSVKLYFSAMRGLDKVTESKQGLVGQCMKSKNKVQSAATFAGLVTLEVDPMCVDYDERECGETFNADACQDGANMCPSVGVFSVSPLTTSVGGTINVAATGNDPDGNFVTFLWTSESPGVVFGDPEASSTSFTCPSPGTHTIKVTVADAGACTDFETANVTCL